jgi:hypothetical protein
VFGAVLFLYPFRNQVRIKTTGKGSLFVKTDTEENISCRIVLSIDKWRPYKGYVTQGSLLEPHQTYS